MTADPWLQTALWALLEDEEVVVETVAWSEEMTKQTARWQPALAIVDVSCWSEPRRERVVTKIREIGAAGIPVLILDRVPWTGEQVRRTGGSGFLRKPFVADDLRDRVETILRTSRE